MAKKLFPTDLPQLEWTEFAADGFSGKVAGLIHRKAAPAENGMPLGAIGTGCIDLETDGTLGYCTIFNSHVPRRGPINLPFLGLSLVQEKTKWVESWLLSTRGLSHEMDSADTWAGRTEPARHRTFTTGAIIRWRTLNMSWIAPSASACGPGRRSFRATWRLRTRRAWSSRSA